MSGGLSLIVGVSPEVSASLGKTSSTMQTFCALVSVLRDHARIPLSSMFSTNFSGFRSGKVACQRQGFRRV